MDEQAREPESACANSTAPLDADRQPWLFHTNPWEPEFLSRFPRAQHVVRIACPFIKMRNTRLILASLPPRPRTPVLVRVLTRLNAPDCRARVHDIAAMELLLENPLLDRCRIEVRVNNALHAKCFVFDADEAIITSSNLTFSAFHKNIEVALATGHAAVVAAITKYFDAIFEKAQPLTGASIGAVKSLIAVARPSVPIAAPDVEEPLAVADAATPLSMEPSPSLDATALNVIDEASAKQLERDVGSGFTVIEGASSNTHECQNAFFRDVAQALTALMGGPTPTDEQLAWVFVHPSAHDLLTVPVDACRTDCLQAVGKRAWSVIVAEALIQASRRPLAPDDLVQKVNYVVKSNHLVRVLAEVGLNKLLISPSLCFSNSADDRGRTFAYRSAASRLVGLLVESRPWRELSRQLIALADLEGSFPFESYRDHNYKSELQRYTQERYGTSPSYQVVEKRGPEHDVTFAVEVRVGGRVLGSGEGAPRKVAEMHAAFEALKGVRLEAQRVAHTTPTPIDHELRRSCDEDGRRLLTMLVGFDLPASLACCVLVPTGTPRTEYAEQREELAVLGGFVRDLLAYKKCSLPGMCGGDVSIIESAMNRGDRLLRLLRQTPLWRWYEGVAQDVRFRSAWDRRVVLESINALFGALYTVGGPDACMALTNLLFRSEDVPGKPASLLPAKSRLQQVVQQVTGLSMGNVVTLDVRELHEKHQTHRALFEVRVIVNTRELGRATGRTKRDSENAACELALANPRLHDLLEQAANSDSSE